MSNSRVSFLHFFSILLLIFSAKSYADPDKGGPVGILPEKFIVGSIAPPCDNDTRLFTSAEISSTHSSGFAANWGHGWELQDTERRIRFFGVVEEDCSPTDFYEGNCNSKLIGDSNTFYEGSGQSFIGIVNVIPEYVEIAAIDDYPFALNLSYNTAKTLKMDNDNTFSSRIVAVGKYSGRIGEINSGASRAGRIRLVYNPCDIFPGLCDGPNFCEKYPGLCHGTPEKPNPCDIFPGLCDGPNFCEKYPELCDDPDFCEKYPELCDDPPEINDLSVSSIFFRQKNTAPIPEDNTSAPPLREPQVSQENGKLRIFSSLPNIEDQFKNPIAYAVQINKDSENELVLHSTALRNLDTEEYGVVPDENGEIEFNIDMNTLKLNTETTYVKVQIAIFYRHCTGENCQLEDLAQNDFSVSVPYIFSIVLHVDPESNEEFPLVVQCVDNTSNF